ncbi:MAG: hypothetical protein Q8L06_05400 [Pseudohongiella sp.]|nr:hypothetical protein [Pseudohongiella sp.]
MHHHMFHKLSHNPFLLDKGLAVNPEGHSNEALLQRIWQLMELKYIVNQQSLVETFAQAHGQGLGSDDIALVAEAAARWGSSGFFRLRWHATIIGQSSQALGA